MALVNLDCNFFGSDDFNRLEFDCMLLGIDLGIELLWRLGHEGDVFLDQHRVGNHETLPDSGIAVGDCVVAFNPFHIGFARKLGSERVFLIE